MEAHKVWPLTIALSVLAAVIGLVYWLCQSGLRSQEHDLAITAYLNCRLKYDVAKASGKLPSGEPLPSGSEVCAKYK